jgi:GNAT superfamily N-acetyltransferase
MTAIALAARVPLAHRCALAFPQPPPLRRLCAALAALAARLRRLVQPPRLELRIDVSHPDERIEAELDALYLRLNTPGDAMNACTRLPALRPGLVFHHREADGEHYLYVEDPARGRLAGYTVFNRLIEVDRRTDRHVRSPHSKYAPAYQGRGIASAVYDWALGYGFCLVSGARQSESAHALWRALARRHPLRWVALRARRMHDLGAAMPPAGATELDTRMMLLGHGWGLAQLHARGLLQPAARAANAGRMRRRA